MVIEAVQLTQWVRVETPEGVLTGSPGDWLITGVKGEQYPCANDIFRATYEPVDEDESLDGGDPPEQTGK